jgi:flagellum-specific peptidoglycan hydrolase FlgJ
MIRVEVWVYPDQKQAVKDYADALVSGNRPD